MEGKDIVSPAVKAAAALASAAVWRTWTVHGHTERYTYAYDGDTCSFNVAYLEDSKKEVEKLLNNVSYYIGPDGNYTVTINGQVHDYVMHNLTSE